jgi:hypothetical protein
MGGAKGIAVAGVAAVVLLGALVFWSKYFSQQPSVMPTASTPASQPAVRSVVVLPFRDLSLRPSEESWGIGMTDAIITRLLTHDAD